MEKYFMSTGYNVKQLEEAVALDSEGLVLPTSIWINERFGSKCTSQDGLFRELLKQKKKNIDVLLLITNFDKGVLTPEEIDCLKNSILPLCKQGNKVVINNYSAKKMSLQRRIETEGNLLFIKSLFPEIDLAYTNRATIIKKDNPFNELVNYKDNPEVVIKQLKMGYRVYLPEIYYKSFVNCKELTENETTNNLVILTKDIQKIKSR